MALQLQQPEGLASIQSEILQTRQKWLDAHPGQTLTNDVDHLYSWITETSTPLLSSCIQESLRLSTSVLSIRRVMKPTMLGGYKLEPGQNVVNVTRMVHLDEDIHQDAQSFEPARYLDDGVSKKYIKDGKAVRNHSMPWGGGVSMCEGR
jgi:cytochrome P450